jgi:sodium-dependent dicarboxylate transporter 2/3/5
MGQVTKMAITGKKAVSVGKPYQRIGLILGPIVFFAILAAPLPESLKPEAGRVAAAALLMAVWWATEAIPVPVTALLPIALFPILSVGTIRQATEPFANPLIFLFLGGFLIALAMQRWQLHRRVAFFILRRMHSGPAKLIAGFMAATAVLSMWVSNTATTMMMLPIAISVIAVVVPRAAETTIGSDKDMAAPSNFAIALLLGIAYAANIGGIGTLIGTPPNALLAAFMSERFAIEIGFAQWLMIGVPVVLVMLPLAWLILTKVVYPPDLEIDNISDLVSEQYRSLAAISDPEKRVAAVAILTALLWVLRPSLNELSGLSGLSDAGIAIAGALLLFVVPAGGGHSGSLMDWRGAKDLPWGTLILFGGGLSLASAISDSGLAAWIGDVLVVFKQLPTIVIVLIVTTVIIVLTELTSNTATTAAFLPVVAALAMATGNEAITFALPAALAASCAFMLPVATPPNAIVYGSELVTVPQMVRAGIVLNIIGIAAISGLAWLLVPVLR